MVTIGLTQVDANVQFARNDSDIIARTRPRKNLSTFNKTDISLLLTSIPS